ncbi:hypothetical protein JK361_40105 [Streptomyces sp. 5-8]|uniref:Type II secretion system protein GspF domain-containing protein n=1 Tax=Streptomyces musisoli TaxID=2802280 RepID=A0ABS1PE72_9ACTN|nr:hypothetical protein [Streptomyces musisoli]MBL1110673.1 hypothetical protein [Streptomyces musisoli]
MVEANRPPEPNLRRELARLRSAIRRDTIDWWQSSHPDGDPPETIRQVIALWFSGQLQGIVDLPEKRAERLRLNARIQASRVHELKALDAEDATVVAEAIRAAHWTDNSRASWSLVLDDFVEDHGFFVFPIIFLVVIFPLGWVWPWLVQEDDFKEIGAGGMLAAFVLLALLMALHGRILALLRATLPKSVQLWRAAVMTGVAYMLFEGRWQRDLRQQVSRQKEHVPRKYHDVMAHADLCAVYALKWFLALVVAAFIISAGSSLLYRAGPKEPADAVVASRMLLELLNLASWSQAALDRANGATEGFRPYIASDERRNMLRCLDRVAHVAEGNWRRSLKVGDHIADSAVADLGQGIAASARRWKTVASIGGERLEEMSQAFAAALLDASRGDWELLVSEVSGRELLRRRMLRITRHLIALSLMIGSAYVVLMDPFGWLGKTNSPTVGSFLLMLAAIVSVSIDPTIVERFANASKVTAHFTAKK